MINLKLYSAHKKLCCILIIYLMLCYPTLSVSAQTWQPQVSGIGNSLHSVFFLDEFNGWAVGSYGAIVHTTNGGENWNQQTSGTNQDLNCVCFTDTATGWTCGSQGTILKTTDGGNSWTPQNSFTVYELFSIDFTSASTGWVVGIGGTILKTTNGGSNWIPQNSPFSDIITDVDFIDSLYGWAATSTSGATEATIIKTTDGGDFWELVTVPMLIPFPVFSVDFIDRNTGWVVGYLEIIYKSTDSGYTWIEQQFATSETVLYSVSFADEHNGWTVGSGGLIDHTSDGGNLWETQISGTTNILWDVYFVNPTTGWIVGDNGLILKYTNPVSVDNAEANSTPNQFTLKQNYPNPFNPTTTIQYSIPESGNVSLKIFNALGEEAADLVNEYQQPGIYRVNFIVGNLSSGIYYYRLNSGSYSSVRKMIILK
ncbi:MAG: YCF48-related protein [Ignavibacteriaceae bacterium]|nr:YCF48-related protein [Chlorobium sp.]MCW8824536.1 YCF48-related protein [Ignavibacteriaceae bacterium]MCW9097872.1 YCF48-related protein [Ignavibacteriaceae bacterium]